MWKYYIQVPLIPVYFIMLVLLETKDVIIGAYWETKDVWKSHKRHYNK